MVRGMMRNIGEDQKEIGDNGKEDKEREKELQKQFGRKKKKLSKKNQKLGNRQKKTKIKWVIQLTPTMNCKILGMRNLEKEIML